MVTAYLIYEGQFPSINHARFLDEEECKKEVARLEWCRKEHNRKCDESKLTPHFRGKAFMFIKRENVFTYQKREFDA